MNRLRRMFEGKYGFDQLNVALGILSCLITFSLSFIRVPYYRLFGLIPLVFVAIRAFSTDFAARQKENEKFLKVFLPLKNYFVKKYRQFQDKEHKYYDCSGCSHTLRVPKNKGKIEITCPYCGRKFKRNTGRKSNQCPGIKLYFESTKRASGNTSPVLFYKTYRNSLQFICCYVTMTKVIIRRVRFM